MSDDLPVRAPFDGAALLDWLSARAVPGVEEVVGARYRRVVSASVVLDVELGPDRAVLHAGPPESAATLVDADGDPAAVASTLSADPVLAPLVARAPGLRCPGTVDPAELAIRAVLGQQVSVAAARTLAGRLALEHGEPVDDPGGGLSRAFPAAAVLAELDPESLPMPRSRGRTVVGLAAALASGALVLDRADPAGSRAALLGLRGIGPWTADYVAMRALGDRDAFPVTDLVVRQAAERLGLPATPRGLLARAEAWRPWRAYATHHLWASASDVLAR